jgi:hypothetical protein
VHIAGYFAPCLRRIDMTRYRKTTLSAAILAATLISVPALAGSYPTDFAALDADKNGQVTFAEYSAVVKTSGMTTTAAAQQFTRISAGDAVITEDELNLALAFEGQPYALQAVTGGQPDISYVSAPEFTPQVSEVQDSPVAVSEPIIIETPAPKTAMDGTVIMPEPEINVVTEPVTEGLEPITASTVPEAAPDVSPIDLPEAEVPEAQDSGDILEELEPEPEG